MRVPAVALVSLAVLMPFIEQQPRKKQLIVL